MPDNIKGGLVISDRPQISVEESQGMLTITVVAIGADFMTVEHKEVSMPMDCAEEVANAILALTKA